MICEYYYAKKNRSLILKWPHHISKSYIDTQLIIIINISYPLYTGPNTMISDYLFKGIDNILHDKMSFNRPKSIFTKENIKRDLSTVVKKSSNISQQQYEQQQPLGPVPFRKGLSRPEPAVPPYKQNTYAQEPNISKSRLKAYLESDKESKLQSVIRKSSTNIMQYEDNSPTRSRSPISQLKSGYKPQQQQSPQFYPQAYQGLAPNVNRSVGFGRPYQPQPQSQTQMPMQNYAPAPQYSQYSQYRENMYMNNNIQARRNPRMAEFSPSPSRPSRQYTQPY